MPLKDQGIEQKLVLYLQLNDPDVITLEKGCGCVVLSLKSMMVSMEETMEIKEAGDVVKKLHTPLFYSYITQVYNYWHWFLLFSSKTGE